MALFPRILLVPFLAVIATFSLQGTAQVEDAVATVANGVITVKTDVVLYGDDATRSTVDRVSQGILGFWATDSYGRPWTYTDPSSRKVYRVEFKVNVSLYDGKELQEPAFILDSWNPSSRKNYIEVVQDRKHRSNVLGQDEGKWAATDYDWVYAHEFGHLLGLKDRYTDKNGADKGWDGNIMGEFFGIVEQRNIDSVVRNAAAAARPKSHGGSTWPVRSGAGFTSATAAQSPVRYEINGSQEADQ